MIRRAAAPVVLAAVSACTPPRSRSADLDVAPICARAGVPAIAYAAVSPSEVVAIGAAGEADVERGVFATADTVFDAASIAKLVVATTVMQLVEEGRASLDADVSSYVGFPVRHRGMAITLRMLLSHTSAIRDHDLVERADPGGRELASYLRGYLVERGASAFHDADPGAEYAYSNVGAALAALAVERARGRGFREVARTRVFDPLGMRSARWSADGAAAPYEGGRRVPPPSHAVWPASDLHASARDLARFARMLLREGEIEGTRVLSRESVRAMLGGLGFQVRTIGATRVAGHEGEDEGATAALFVDPASRSGAIVLANGDAFASNDPARADAIQGLLLDLLARGARR